MHPVAQHLDVTESATPQLWVPVPHVEVSMHVDQESGGRPRVREHDVHEETELR